MPGNDFYPDELTRQRCLTDKYDKERETRLRWYFNTIKPNRGSEEQTSRQHEVLLRRLQAACPKPTEELQRLREQGYTSKDTHLPKLADREPEDSKKRRDLETREEGDQRTRFPAIDERNMKETDIDTRRQIYNGTSREGRGRIGYLRSRNNLNPENKYYYPLVTSWEYGWRLGDVIKVDDLRNPEYGRSRIVADTFYSNTLNSLSHQI